MKTRPFYLSLLAVGLAASAACANDFPEGEEAAKRVLKEAGKKKKEVPTPKAQEVRTVLDPSSMREGPARQTVEMLLNIKELEPRELIKDWYYDFTVYYKECIDRQVDAVVGPAKEMMERESYQEAITLVNSIKKCTGHKDLSNRAKYPLGDHGLPVILGNWYPGVYYKMDSVDGLVDAALQLIENEKLKKEQLAQIEKAKRESLGGRIGGIVKGPDGPKESPEDILRRRFAKGEVSRKEFMDRTIDLLKDLYARGQISYDEYVKRLNVVFEEIKLKNVS